MKDVSGVVVCTCVYASVDQCAVVEVFRLWKVVLCVAGWCLMKI